MPDELTEIDEAVENQLAKAFVSSKGRTLEQTASQFGLTADQYESIARKPSFLMKLWETTLVFEVYPKLPGIIRSAMMSTAENPNPANVKMVLGMMRLLKDDGDKHLHFHNFSDAELKNMLASMVRDYSSAAGEKAADVLRLVESG